MLANLIKGQDIVQLDKERIIVENLSLVFEPNLYLATYVKICILHTKNMLKYIVTSSCLNGTLKTYLILGH